MNCWLLKLEQLIYQISNYAFLKFEFWMHESQSLEKTEETLSSICILQMQIVHSLLSVFPNCAGFHFHTALISKSGVRVNS